MAKLFSKKKTSLILTMFLVIFSVLIVFVLSRRNKELNTRTNASNQLSNYIIPKKVYVLIYNPTLQLEGNPTLVEFKNWNNPNELVQQLENWFLVTSEERVRYNIVSIEEIDAIPIKEDGFEYTQASYLECLEDETECHKPDIADYSEIFNNNSICEKFNNGEFDELWMIAGPWFGFYESRLTGPNAFYYNSPPLRGTSCNKLLPIMGFNYERGLENMVHDYGHRLEDTMKKVYGSWDRNSSAHNWNKFALVDSQANSFDFSGCGFCHFPPNAIDDYAYSDTRNVRSYCNQFYNYPNLDNLSDNTDTISCDVWGCNELGYFRWLFRHMPKYQGYGPDKKLNDWWMYLIDPNIVLTNIVPDYCPTITPTPTPTKTATSSPVITGTSTEDSTPTEDPETTITYIPTSTEMVTESPIDKKSDFNKDGKVNIVDFRIFIECYKAETSECDLNRDTKVDLYDFVEFRMDYLQENS
ncbi:hypothetical protein GF362_02240 [Candidatus Dojkabacteria bacterium]|nr:hypothetical protein [Candidatus Dojkabacteria bacterium]